MGEVLAQVRQWGRSIGVVIPKEAAQSAHLKSGDTIRLLIMGKKSPISETFGVVKLKRSTKEILKDVDREGWDE